MEKEKEVFKGILFFVVCIVIVVLILVYHFREYNKKMALEEQRRQEDAQIKRIIENRNKLERDRVKLQTRKQEDDRLKHERIRKQHLKNIEEDRLRNNSVKESSLNKTFKKGDEEYIDNGEYLIGSRVYISVWAFKTKNNILPNENDINGKESQFHASNVSNYYSCVPDFGAFETVKIFPHDEMEWYYLSRKL